MKRTTTKSITRGLEPMEREVRWAWDLVERGKDDSGSVLIESRAEKGNTDGTTLFVASTDSPDRAMDVVKQNWRLAEFRSNPVILDNHNPLRVVGHAVEAIVPKAGDDAGKLMIRVKWDTDNPNPEVRGVGHQHLAGIRRAGSVGFRSEKKTRRDKLPADHEFYQAPIEIETFWGREKYAGTLFESPVLLEFSSATIPMNAQALQRSFELFRREDDPEAEAPADDTDSDVDPWAWLADDEQLDRVAQALLPAFVRALFPKPEKDAPADEPVAEMAMRMVRPTVLDILRTDPARRIVQAYAQAGPPPVDLFTRVAQLLEQS